jgi:hypothetical protein
MKANQAKMDDNLRERWQDAQPNWPYFDRQEKALKNT